MHFASRKVSVASKQEWILCPRISERGAKWNYELVTANFLPLFFGNSYNISLTWHLTSLAWIINHGICCCFCIFLEVRGSTL